MRSWGLRLYRLALRSLPSWLRNEAGEAMEASFSERQRHMLDRVGRHGLPVLWAREIGGLVRCAVRSRWPDRWHRRTDRGSGGTSGEPPTRRWSADHVRLDLRFALRSFSRRKAMTALAVGTMALGIGASTSMFSIIHSVLLRPLPYPAPEELVSVYPSWPQLRGHPTLGHLAERGTWSWPEFWMVAESQTVFREFAAFEGGAVTLRGDGRPERVSAAWASYELFPMLGANPVVGRLLNEDDGADGPAGVALLGHDYWRTRFGSDPGVVGRTLNLDDRGVLVVGVLDPGFAVRGVEASLWLPRAGSPTDPGLGNHTAVRAVARLAPGVEIPDATKEVERILRSRLPPEHGEHGASVFPRREDETRTARPVLVVLLGASLLLLLVACGNVAALLLGYGIERERELAVRGAIGASRPRLAQQLLSESVFLAALGAAVGVGLASLSLRGLVYLAPPGVARLDEAAINGTVLAWSVGAALVCGVGFGCLPALGLSRVDLLASLGTTRGSGRRTRLQAAVVVGELALATVLLVSGTLLGRTVLALDRVDPGFDPEGLLLVSIAPSQQTFVGPEGSSDLGAQDAYYRGVLEEISTLPGVTGVAMSSVPPFFRYRANNDVLPEGWSDPDNAPIAERRFVTANYFEILGIPIVEGRPLVPSDEDAGAEIAVVVSQGFADLAWPDDPAVGKHLRFWGVDARVVGVAANIRDEVLDRSTELAFYAPIRQTSPRGGPIVVRTAGDPAALIPAVRERIWTYDPDVPVNRAAAMDDLMSGEVSDQRYRARLMAVFAVLAAVFALMGIYGVTSRSVARRTKEMGIRLALGAGAHRVRRLVTYRAVGLAVMGVALGLSISVAAGGILEAFLWGVARTDPLTLASVGLGLPLAAAVAAAAPARRATAVDPARTLRSE